MSSLTNVAEACHLSCFCCQTNAFEILIKVVHTIYDEINQCNGIPFHCVFIMKFTEQIINLDSLGKLPVLFRM